MTYDAVWQRSRFCVDWRRDYRAAEMRLATWRIKIDNDTVVRENAVELSLSPNRLLTNGDWVGAARQILEEMMCRDVPVPLFQHAAEGQELLQAHRQMPTEYLTHRKVINRAKRRAGIVTFTAFAVIALCAYLSTTHQGYFPFVVIGIAGFIGGIFYLHFGIRCPNCRGSIGSVTAHSGSPFSISDEIRFCPFCGIALDAQSRNRDPEVKP